MDVRESVCKAAYCVIANKFPLQSLSGSKYDLPLIAAFVSPFSEGYHGIFDDPGIFSVVGLASSSHGGSNVAGTSGGREEAFGVRKLLKGKRRKQKLMKELERGAIANPNEGRMVCHYWLRNAKLTLNPFLQVQINKTLAAVCDFADNVISGKIKPPSSPEGRFTQILSVGIGGSALGPQFVAEALAPDNPPFKILLESIIK